MDDSSSYTLPVKENITADFMSRLQNENTEWRLPPAIFHKILRVFYFKPEIDIFACLNYQIPKYVSWYPNKNAVAIDAFSMSWSNLNFYAFPLSLIGAVLAEIKQEQCSGIMVIPWLKTSLVSHDGKITSKLPCAIPTKHLDFAIEQICATPTVAKNKIVGHSVMQAFLNTSVPSEIANVITNSWRTTVKSWYQMMGRICYIKEYGSLYCRCEQCWHSCRVCT